MLSPIRSIVVPLKKIRCVLDPPAQPACSFRQTFTGCVTLLAITCLPAFTRTPQSRSNSLLRGTFCIDEHHLKHRPDAEIPFRVQLLHQFLERQVLVRICLQRHFPHPPQHLPETSAPP